MRPCMFRGVPVWYLTVCVCVRRKTGGPLGCRVTVVRGPGGCCAAVLMGL